METTITCTLITGASSGLGRELAIECARRKRNLLLIALPGRNLDEFCEQLSANYSIQAYAFEGDLTDKDFIYRLVKEILEKYRVNFLINNAGMGGTVPFQEASVEYLDAIIQLNVRATSILTRLLLEELKSHPRAYILNVSSMAAFSPIPYKTIYPASKAFVYSFSRGLSEELKGTPVRVAVLNPGPILTNPDVITRIMRQGIFGKMGLLTAGTISRITLSAIFEGKHVIIPGFFNNFNHWLMKFFPESFRLRILGNVIQREIVKFKQSA
jgi:short-subunit dehydrogenase